MRSGDGCHAIGYDVLGLQQALQVGRHTEGTILLHKRHCIMVKTDAERFLVAEDTVLVVVVVAGDEGEETFAADRGCR